MEYDTIDPSFTCLKEGEELFRFITVAYNDELTVFDHNVKETVRSSTPYFDIGQESKRSNFVFISALPWIPFTAISHTLSLKKTDTVPRVSWGKFFSSDGKILLPYDVQVNHMLIDGLHIGKLYEKLCEEIRLFIHA